MGAVGTYIAISSSVVLGAYTIQNGDTAEDMMRGLLADVNADTPTHSVTAVWDGEKLVFIDATESYTTLYVNVDGATTYTKEDFTAWSTQFYWEDDIEAMNDIAEILLDQMGISSRDIPLVQWAAKEKAE